MNANEARNWRLAIGGVIGFFTASLFNSILVVAKEMNKEVFNSLAQTFGHHWLGHGILAILVFFIVTGTTYALYRGTGSLENWQ